MFSQECRQISLKLCSIAALHDWCIAVFWKKNALQTFLGLLFERYLKNTNLEKQFIALRMYEFSIPSWTTGSFLISMRSIWSLLKTFFDCILWIGAWFVNRAFIIEWLWLRLRIFRTRASLPPVTFPFILYWMLLASAPNVFFAAWRMVSFSLETVKTLLPSWRRTSLFSSLPRLSLFFTFKTGEYLFVALTSFF